MTNDPNNKKDLTGIFDLQKLQAENPDPAAIEVPIDPFAVNEMQAIEQVDSFDSIDQIGMMDHPADHINENASENSDHQVDPFALSAPEPAVDFSNEFSTMEPETSPTLETPVLENLKNYSEQSQGKTNLEVKINYPFHLKMNGVFGPFERDKLLMFITENPIGLSSSELDLQIQAGRVFFPRISEYAAIKLVQELRDSGLSFSLNPSDQENNISTANSSSKTFYYQNEQNVSASISSNEIPILNEISVLSLKKPFQEIDEVSIVQFVKTELLEIENSPIIQEVIERMTESLKQKARLKGGNALLNLKKEVLTLRLPSQYQISLTASVIQY